jgi:hypothetical protein
VDLYGLSVSGDFLPQVAGFDLSVDDIALMGESHPSFAFQIGSQATTTHSSGSDSSSTSSPSTQTASSQQQAQAQAQQINGQPVQEAQNAAQPTGNGSTSVVTVSVTSSAPGTLLGGLIGELIDPIGGGIPGSILGGMVGTGASVSYVPSTDSWYAGPTISFTPAPFGGNGVSASDVIVPSGQNANSIANGTSYSVTFQPTPLTGSTVAKSPGSGPAVAGPAVGTKVPLSLSASHNFDITQTVHGVTHMVNNAIKTVESWF